jgi:hypothetical protein
MDWMCEPHMTAKTGLTVREHQQRTVENYLRLRDHGPFIPVLQGWEPGEYLACVELYEQYGVDLTTLPLVGVGSVCRRQSDHEIGWIFRTLAGSASAATGSASRRLACAGTASTWRRRIRLHGRMRRAVTRRWRAARMGRARTVCGGRCGGVTNC